MVDTKVDLLLHPVRMRILLLLVGERKLTAQQMSDELPDVPHATLYRHVNILNKGGILVVVGENRVRGTIEKVYALAEHSENVSADDVATASREDHMRYFMTFTASLLDQYQRYLNQDCVDLEADMVSYRQAPLYLSDQEATEMLHDIVAVVRRFMANEPTPDRRRRTLSTVFIPEPRPVSDREEV